MDANKRYGKKAWRQLHKTTASNTEQVLEVASHKAAAVRPPTTKTIQVRRTRHARHCWRSKDELISDIFLWTPSHGRAKARRLARTYIQPLCIDTGYSIVELPGAMDDRDGWWERVREIRACGATWWWWWYNDQPVLYLNEWWLRNRSTVSNLSSVYQTWRILVNNKSH